jgi:hypothetical protein
MAHLYCSFKRLDTVVTDDTTSTTAGTSRTLGQRLDSGLCTLRTLAKKATDGVVTLVDKAADEAGAAHSSISRDLELRVLGFSTKAAFKPQQLRTMVDSKFSYRLASLESGGQYVFRVISEIKGDKPKGSAFLVHYIGSEIPAPGTNVTVVPMTFVCEDGATIRVKPGWPKR